MIQLWNPWASCLRDLVEKRLRNSFGSKKLCKTKLIVPIVLAFYLYTERENMRGRGGLGPEEPNFDVLKNGHIL